VTASRSVLFAGAPAAALVMAVVLGGAARLEVSSGLLGAAALLAAAALGPLVGASLHSRRAFALVAGAATAGVLAGVPRVLRFDLSVAGVGESGVGLILGLMLLSALAGSLATAADALCPGASRWALVLGRRAFLLAAGLGILADGLLLKDALAGVELAALAGVGAACAAAAWTLALAGLDSPDADAAPTSDVWTLRAAAALTVLALLAAGHEAWQGRGSYRAAPVPCVLLAALAAVAAVQETRLRAARVGVLLAALAAALVYSV
jgi:hypothetical protein